ncbi:uncharacterized protein A4U43_C09F15120 [Asparagus officinalis]|uniref:RING-type domain-containing protein n=1 Tax=Asparagus officinalis TaxID=4686 RepID=A0A5P1E852_ASPOF|nr:E3 ubiquitin-protein ligase RNF185-like [Asparagus officinalis]ONK58639.1 uncharacterized protein A4U43_C09F15120 [Asparagus officinalis]
MSRSRPNEEKLQDLELRLAPSFLKERALGFLRRSSPEFIIIDDDDEDEVEQVHAPTSSRETRRFFPCPSSSVTGISEGDLELRLTVGASNGSSGNKDCGDASARKCCECGQASKGHFTEVKLRCAICMDTMKEETSTLCGHIFCKPCITNSILELKKCPTCRKELSLGSIHRIFLPGATS